MELIYQGISQARHLLIDGDPLVWNAAFRTLWISLLAVTLASLIGVPTGSFLACRRFPGSQIIVLLFRTGLSIPTVLIGLVCYAMLSRRGPLGALELLYTPWGIVLGEFFLAFPILVCWSHESLVRLDDRIRETAFTLGAGPLRRFGTYLSEARLGLTLAFLTAFARCLTELGIAMMVGGNIKFRTRTLATATALETARGEFARGIAMCSLLLLLALLVTTVIGWVNLSQRDRS